LIWCHACRSIRSPLIASTIVAAESRWSGSGRCRKPHIGRTNHNIQKKLQVLPPNTKRCQMVWLIGDRSRLLSSGFSTGSTDPQENLSWCLSERGS
jgi:hypothetical protein